MSLTQYWKDVEKLVGKYQNAVAKNEDEGLVKACKTLSEMIHLGKQLETFGVLAVAKLYAVGGNLKALGKDVGVEGLPNVTGEVSLAFAKEYLALLEQFASYTTDTTKLISAGISDEIQKTKEMAVKLRERIENFEAKQKQNSEHEELNPTAIEDPQVVSKETSEHKDQIIEEDEYTKIRNEDNSISEQKKLIEELIAKVERNELELEELINFEKKFKQVNGVLSEQTEIIIQDLKQNLEKTLPLEKRLEAYIEHENQLEFFEKVHGDFSDQENYHCIYDSLKPLLTDDQQKRWSHNETLSGGGYTAWINWFKGFASYASEKPQEPTQLLQQLISEQRVSLSRKLVENLDQEVESRSKKLNQLRQNLILAYPDPIDDIRIEHKIPVKEAVAAPKNTSTGDSIIQFFNRIGTTLNNLFAPLQREEIQVPRKSQRPEESEEESQKMTAFYKILSSLFAPLQKEGIQVSQKRQRDESEEELQEVTLPSKILSLFAPLQKEGIQVSQKRQRDESEEELQEMAPPATKFQKS